MTPDLSRRSLLRGGAVASLGAILIEGRTAAFLNDVESVPNTAAVGTLDCKLDWQETYWPAASAEPVPIGASPDENNDGIQDPIRTRSAIDESDHTLTDEQVEARYRSQFADDVGPTVAVDDVQAGDRGRLFVGVHCFGNPACVTLAGVPPQGNGIPIDVDLWIDADCETGEGYTSEDYLIASGPAEAVLGEEYALGTMIDDAGGETYPGCDPVYDVPCLGLEWSIPNDAQIAEGSSAEFGLGFHAEQCRHSTCSPAVVTPTETPTATPTETPTETYTQTATETPTATTTPTVTETEATTVTPVDTPSATPSPTPTATPTTTATSATTDTPTQNRGPGISFVVFSNTTCVTAADVSFTVNEWKEEPGEPPEPYALSWSSDVSLDTVVVKTGPTMQNVPGGTAGTTTSGAGTDAGPDQSPPSPCPDGQFGPKFEYDANTETFVQASHQDECVD